MDINKIVVKRFKSLYNIEFTPGNVNVFIGANGAGKSTILEAIGLLSAAMTDRVDNDSLIRKGIRLSAPSLYKSSFKNTERRSPTIELGIDWASKDSSHQYSYTVNLNTPSENTAWRYHSEGLYEGEHKIWGRSGASKTALDKHVGGLMMEAVPILQNVRASIDDFKSYAIYEPMTPVLRGTMSDPIQKDPIGLSGGRLAEAVEDLLFDGTEFSNRYGIIPYDDVLDLLDWAEDFKVAAPSKARVNSSVSTTRRIIEFKDRFMKDSDRFTAYDASEGALYVLFLISLAVHSLAPKVFAIDSFDHAMHPRLARAATRLFCNLILKNNRTAFITTHNPLVLDGLDLQNDRIKLFTVERSRQSGYCNITPISITPSLLESGYSLSRLWVDGRLGGVPNLL